MPTRSQERAVPLLALLLLPALLLPVFLAPAASGFQLADGERSTWLYAHWPPTVVDGFGGEVPMDDWFPLGEDDLSQGPLLPGAASAGTAAAFTYALTTARGEIGPDGPLTLDASVPARLVVFLSADATGWPPALGPAPVELDYGVVPNVTVEATLRFGDEAVARGSVTHDLVTLPDPVATGPAVQTFDVALAFEQATVAPGEGVFVDVRMFQADVADEAAMQPLWNLHSGEAYPTGVLLPIVNPQNLELPPGYQASDEAIWYAGTNGDGAFVAVETSAIPALAAWTLVLVGALTTAGVTLGRMLRARNG